MRPSWPTRISSASRPPRDSQRNPSIWWHSVVAVVAGRLLTGPLTLYTSHLGLEEAKNAQKTEVGKLVLGPELTAFQAISRPVNDFAMACKQSTVAAYAGQMTARAGAMSCSLLRALMGGGKPSLLDHAGSRGRATGSAERVRRCGASTRVLSDSRCLERGVQPKGGGRVGRNAAGGLSAVTVSGPP